MVIFVLVSGLRRARRAWLQRATRRRVWLVILGVFLASTGLQMAAASSMSAAPDAWPLLPVILFLVLPFSLLRSVLVPLGLSRAAFRAVKLADSVLGLDDGGGPALAAAWALLRRPLATSEDVAWVEQKVSEVKPLRGGGLVAAALLQARRGDKDDARRLLESSFELAPAARSAMASRVAREWLAADAASRGDWARVVELAARLPRSQTSRAVSFLGAVGRRLLRLDGAPSDEELWLLWLLGSRRTRMRPLLIRALSVPRGPVQDAAKRPDPEPGPLAPSDPLAHALELQLRLWGQPPSLAEVGELGRAWDAALADPQLERRLLIRSLELGAAEGASLRSRIGDMAADGLAQLARSRELPLGEVEAPGPTLERAARRLRGDLLSEIELASGALRRRAVDKRELPAVDEWREWLALRARYEHGARLAGQEARRLAWPRVRDDVCKLSVWLWNVRGEKAIAHAMFGWLLGEARAMSDQEAIELQEKNVACGPGA
jgi:hypothetical protein